jgi:hypothetical protein
MVATHAHTAGDLLAKPAAELDALFRHAPAGQAPHGDAEGTALLVPGSGVAAAIAGLVRRLLWQGKVLFPDGTLVNKVTPWGLPAVRGVVAPGPSWVDGKECIVIDYAPTSLVARWVRDEIRLVGPGLYLGVVWLARRRVAAFALAVTSEGPA